MPGNETYIGWIDDDVDEVRSPQCLTLENYTYMHHACTSKISRQSTLNVTQNQNHSHAQNYQLI